MLNWLLTCRAADEEEAQRGRLLNVFLLIFTALALINLVSSLVLGVSELVWVIVVMVGLLLGLYALNRRGAVTLAATSMVILMFLVMHALGVLPGGGIVSSG